tara:strand:- start:997 stop:1884 length:888 start_codon:yes stop_codon:yes gene_type:complete
MNSWTQRNSLLVMHLIVIILGLTGVLGKLIEASSTILVWYRMMIAFFALGLYLLIQKELFKIQKGFIWKLLGVGAIVATHWLFFFESIKVSNVSVAVVCLATSSLFSALIEPFVFKRKISAYELLFGIVVIASLAFALQADVTYFWGYVYGVIAAFLATLFTIFNALYINKVEASKITLVEMLGGCLAMSLYIGLFTKTPLSDFYISLEDTIYLLALGIVCTAFAFVVSVEVMKSLSPYSVIMAVNLEPIYSIVLALILFGESEEMTSSFYIGSSAIILTVFLDGYLKTKNKVMK